MLSLIGLFIFGKTVSGATSWYAIGGMTLQPSEFAKAATALAVAKYISDMQTDITHLKDQLKLFALIAIPAILVLLQNDAGSTLVYGAFFFVLYREGIPNIYLLAVLFLIFGFVLTLKIGALFASIIFALIIIFVFYYVLAKKAKNKLISTVLITLLLFDN